MAKIDATTHSLMVFIGNIMKKLTIFAASVLLSTNLLAGTHTSYDHDNLRTEVYANKNEAYNAGYDLADQIQEMNQSQLRQKFGLYRETMVRNIKIDNTKITVEEFSKNRGETSYQAIINIDYHYKAHESNND